ncbi:MULTISPECIES: reverse transcriptase family protein [Pseudomonas]|uniref:reverse transcriptase family protein n=1 Tax=Pseudomonas TaxID=286 RepID=UPI0008FB9DBE|nr:MULTISPECIES: reverse transcriptase family protein [Pseudomonas]ELK4919205.1 RNA-directed DNA polymerase [Pseudomonas aeruginosa]MBH8965880.1 RNA-directed DNA polymerase [Pseudomonas aeruginosa]MBJ7562062.1 RNA-directed DNA polymerase [Pseudomonas sp. P20]MBJ7564344.1 RNA-directed DNA polymerase [Pseudomonas sp. P22]MBM0725987.1 RNA-directed DNA polymerase [Pseudomonas aeruginosa]
MDELKVRLKDGVDPIQSVDNLCSALDIPRSELDEVLALSDDERYIEISLPKSNGSRRLVYDPHPRLRRIQRRIKSRLLVSQILYPRYLYGSLSDSEYPRDYIRCASIHCGAKVLLKADIKNFFDNISRRLVLEIFERVFHYPEEVSDVLSDLCTRAGVVPQGASTSSFLANLCLLNEWCFVRDIQYEKLRYTRLVDDITISSTTTGKDLSRCMRTLTAMIESAGFELNENKTGIEHVTTKAFSVHGLRINKPSPCLPREEVRRIRADVHNLKRKASVPNARVSFEYRKLYESISGRVNKLKRLNHGRYNELRRQMNAILPLPSTKDIKRCQIMLATLERDYDLHRDSYLYKLRYSRLIHRLGILKRIYLHEAAAIRDALQDLKPEFVNEAD